ncbi:hypothetical protein [Carboxylicivirga taeanensis]|uniref:hypothetical protein n=1 Tax=Carboxylicivirga taeanensis TaxID=1416875 RepID=UPI003F6DD6CA
MKTNNTTQYYTVKNELRGTENPFLLMDAETINSGMDIASLGLLVWLLNRSSDYVINKNYLAKNSNEYFGVGKSRFYAAWEKLEEAGYIISKDKRHGNLKRGTDYSIYEKLDKSVLTTTFGRKPDFEISENEVLPSTDTPNNTSTTGSFNHVPDSFPEIAECASVFKSFAEADAEDGWESDAHMLYYSVHYLNIKNGADISHYKPNLRDLNRLNNALDKHGVQGCIQRIAERFGTTKHRILNPSSIFNDVSDTRDINKPDYKAKVVVNDEDEAKSVNDSDETIDV